MQAANVCISLIQEGNGALRFNDLSGKKMIMLFHFPGLQQGDKADHSRPKQGGQLGEGHPSAPSAGATDSRSHSRFPAVQFLGV